MAQNIPAMPTIEGLHHWAYRCRDAEETRHFYEDILGLPLAHVIKADNVPSTGQYCPYVHIFFKMGDGSYMAFFDLGDDLASDPSPNTPTWVNHIALRMNSLEEIERAKARLEAHGVQVVGITDHKFIKSIYFFDPNGYRLELTHEIGPAAYTEKKQKQAHADLAAWNAKKAELRAARHMPAAAE
jgi:catechol 2,3-dioxygenase-like lactoylglutathione lyase family enzyme